MSRSCKRLLGTKVYFAVTAGVALLAGPAEARADTLVMPYSCALKHGEPVLQPAPLTEYPVLTSREEQPLSICASGGPDCTTIMVHRFTTVCGGEKIAWARVAAAGRMLGIVMPPSLPQGYAPIAEFKARLVLPALARFSATSPAVASEQLSPDGVVDRHADADASPVSAAPWQTSIKAEFRTEASFTALRVAGIAISLLAAMLSACMIAAGRWDLLRWLPEGSARVLKGWVGKARSAIPEFHSRVPGLFGEDARRGPRAADPVLTNALAIATARLAETELLIATLPRDLLLREVLQSEADQIRRRLDGLGDEMTSLPQAKVSATVRAALRDLERIARFANGAVQDSSQRRETFEMPESIHQAYQLLGLNADAAPHVAKKIVDGLRMNWHPDLARDAADRTMREARMKQINAAWDLIKGCRAAA